MEKITQMHCIQPTLTCAGCKKSFDTMPSLNEHMLSIHAVRFYMFDITNSEAHPRQHLEGIQPNLPSLRSKRNTVVKSHEQTNDHSSQNDKSVRLNPTENIEKLVETLAVLIEQETDSKYEVLKKGLQHVIKKQQHGWLTEIRNIDSPSVHWERKETSFRKDKNVKLNSSSSRQKSLIDDDKSASVRIHRDKTIVTSNRRKDSSTCETLTTIVQTVNESKLVSNKKDGNNKTHTESLNLNKECKTNEQTRLTGHPSSSSFYSPQSSKTCNEAIDLSQKKKKAIDKRSAISYFTGDLKLNSSYKISRPHNSEWDKCGKGDNSKVKTVGIYNIPSGLPLRNEQSSGPKEVLNERKESENVLQKDNLVVDDETVENASNVIPRDQNNHLDFPVQIVSRNINRFSCPICSKTFTNKCNYEGHLNRHKGINPFICEFCGQLFSSAHNLRRHRQSTHTPKDEWKTCKLCGKSFPTQHKLKQHVLLCSCKDYSYKCKRCHKAFKHLRNLIMHEAVHTRREYECEICSKKFNSKSGHLHHKKTHFNQYQCSVCHSVFSCQASLHRHLKTHQNQKAHECHVCERSFIQKTSYWIHMLKHHDLTKAQLIVMNPEKHLSRNLHHRLKEISDQVNVEHSEH